MSKSTPTNPATSQPGLLSAEGAPAPLDQSQAPRIISEQDFTSSLISPLGRGVHGKTFWARWLIDELRNTGRAVTVVDADRTNATLGSFFPDVSRPASSEDADVEDCLRAVTEAMMERPGTTLIDFGANDLTLKRVARKLGDFNAYLAGAQIRGVAVHFFGPDRDDLAYLRDMEDGVFAPPATILVLNEALLPSGGSTRLFDPVIESPIFQAAVKRGAVPVFMPRLEAAREVNLHRLGFIAAAAGQPGPDGTRIGPWNRSIINAWRQKMITNHQPVMEWLR
jgi:hypothetical protein